MVKRLNNLDYEKVNQDMADNLFKYQLWKAELITPFLNKKDKIIEIGAGKGNISRILKSSGFNVVSTDIKRRGINKKLDIERECGFINKFDKVVCINVLEHIREDVNALSNLNKILKPKGCLILVVPAFNLLYGSIDKSDCHFRRYNKGEIKRKLTQTGFKTIKTRYFNFIGFFGWLYHSRIRRLSVHSNQDLGRFDKIVPLIKNVESCIRFPFGLSLLAVAKKL
jgi:SAM-dependent methyltransferase